MEMALNMGAFQALDQQELFAVDGDGSHVAAGAILLIGGAVIAGFLAPITCGGSLALYVEGATLGYSLMVMGVGTLCGG